MPMLEMIGAWGSPDNNAIDADVDMSSMSTQVCKNDAIDAIDEISVMEEYLSNGTSDYIAFDEDEVYVYLRPNLCLYSQRRRCRMIVTMSTSVKLFQIIGSVG